MDDIRGPKNRFICVHVFSFGRWRKDGSRLVWASPMTEPQWLHLVQLSQSNGINQSYGWEENNAGDDVVPNYKTRHIDIHIETHTMSLSMSHSPSGVWEDDNGTITTWCPQRELPTDCEPVISMSPTVWYYIKNIPSSLAHIDKVVSTHINRVMFQD